MLLAGRLLVGLLFLVAGIHKTLAYAGSVGYFARLGFPAPEAMVWLAIAIEIGGGLALVAGWHSRKAAWLLLAFVAIATVTGHRFWEFDGAQFTNQLNHFLKNLAIIGALLYVGAAGAGALSVEGSARR